MNLAESLAGSARRDPDRTVIAFREQRISYAELEAEASRLASALAGSGVGAGDRVALWLPNHPAFASVLYGAWKLGAIAVPMHAMLTPPEARHILTDTEARVLVCGAGQYAHATPSVLGDVPSLEEVIVVDGAPRAEAVDFGAFVAAGDDSYAPADLPHEHLALLAYTSGTGGVPKGAMLTHGNLAANLEQVRPIPTAVRGEDTALCVLPLFHIFGLNVVLNNAVHVGAQLVLLERFDAAESLEAIGEHRVSVVAAAPPAYIAWLSLEHGGPEHFRSVRVAVSGAAPLPREVLSGFAERFGTTIWEGYGLTETAPVVTSSSVSGVPKPGSVGRPLPGVEIRLVDPDGVDVVPGDPGEVLVRGPNVFRGYWRQPEETARAFADGWFRTGDIGVIDPDGDLHLVDRKSDLIIVSGFNVYPLEVETVLREHKKVADCAVVGLPDPYQGETVKAFVVFEPGTSGTEEELVDFCGSRLAPYKVPGEIELVAEIPRNATGKVLRRTLRD